MIISAKTSNVFARLEQADAAAFLREIETESIDLLVTSPPYFIGKEYDLSCHATDYEKTIVTLIPDLERIVKPGGSICWQVGNHVLQNKIIPLDHLTANAMKRSIQFHLRNRIIWTYAHGNHERRRFSGRYETILWYTKGDEYYFDLDGVRIPQKYPGKRHYKGPYKGQYSGNPLGKNPGDYWDIGAIWDIPNVKANHVEKTPHPCQFPVALVRRLVLALCPKAGIVLDPFAGSGTSAIAAILERRNFIGCDVEPKYLQIADARLKALASGTLRIREDLPIHTPSGKEKIATTPSHFRFHTGEEQ